MSLTVALRQAHALSLHFLHARLCRRDLHVLRDGGRLSELGGRQTPDLVVQNFLLSLPRLRADDVVIQLVQPRQDDVLLVVERHRILLVAIIGQRGLGCLNLFLLGRQLLSEPLQHVVRGLKLELEVLGDVLLRQRVGGQRRKLRIGGLERHVDQTRATRGLDDEARDEGVDERRLVGSFTGSGRFLRGRRSWF